MPPKGWKKSVAQVRKARAGKARKPHPSPKRSKPSISWRATTPTKGTEPAAPTRHLLDIESRLEAAVIIGVNTAVAAITATMDRHSDALLRLADAMHYDAEARLKVHEETPDHNRVLFETFRAQVGELIAFYRGGDTPVPATHVSPDAATGDEPERPEEHMPAADVIARCEFGHGWRARQVFMRSRVGGVDRIRRDVSPPHGPICEHDWISTEPLPEGQVSLTGGPNTVPRTIGVPDFSSDKPGDEITHCAPDEPAKAP